MSEESGLDRERVIEAWTGMFEVPTWTKKGVYAKCFACQAKFGFSAVRHHCRLCGEMYCSACVGKYYIPKKYEPNAKKAAAKPKPAKAGSKALISVSTLPSDQAMDVPTTVCYTCRETCLMYRQRHEGDWIHKRGAGAFETMQDDVLHLHLPPNIATLRPLVTCVVCGCDVERASLFYCNVCGDFTCGECGTEEKLPSEFTKELSGGSRICRICKHKVNKGAELDPRTPPPGVKVVGIRGVLVEDDVDDGVKRLNSMGFIRFADDDSAFSGPRFRFSVVGGAGAPITKKTEDKKIGIAEAAKAAFQAGGGTWSAADVVVDIAAAKDPTAAPIPKKKTAPESVDKAKLYGPLAGLSESKTHDDLTSGTVTKKEKTEKATVPWKKAPESDSSKPSEAARSPEAVKAPESAPVKPTPELMKALDKKLKEKDLHSEVTRGSEPVKMSEVKKLEKTDAKKEPPVSRESEPVKPSDIKKSSEASKEADLKKELDKKIDVKKADGKKFEEKGEKAPKTELSSESKSTDKKVEDKKPIEEKKKEDKKPEDKKLTKSESGKDPVVKVEEKKTEIKKGKIDEKKADSVSAESKKEDKKADAKDITSSEPKKVGGLASLFSKPKEESAPKKLVTKASADKTPSVSGSTASAASSIVSSAVAASATAPGTREDAGPKKLVAKASAEKDSKPEDKKDDIKYKLNAAFIAGPRPTSASSAGKALKGPTSSASVSASGASHSERTSAPQLDLIDVSKPTEDAGSKEIRHLSLDRPLLKTVRKRPTRLSKLTDDIKSDVAKILKASSDDENASEKKDASGSKLGEKAILENKIPAEETKEVIMSKDIEKKDAGETSKEETKVEVKSVAVELKQSPVEVKEVTPEKIPVAAVVATTAPSIPKVDLGLTIEVKDGPLSQKLGVSESKKEEPSSPVPPVESEQKSPKVDLGVTLEVKEDTLSKLQGLKAGSPGSTSVQDRVSQTSSPAAPDAVSPAMTTDIEQGTSDDDIEDLPEPELDETMEITPAMKSSGKRFKAEGTVRSIEIRWADKQKPLTKLEYSGSETLVDLHRKLFNSSMSLRFEEFYFMYKSAPIPKALWELIEVRKLGTEVVISRGTPTLKL